MNYIRFRVHFLRHHRRRCRFYFCFGYDEFHIVGDDDIIAIDNDWTTIENIQQLFIMSWTSIVFVTISITA